MPRKLDGTYIQTGSITTTQLSSAVTTQISAGGGPRVSSLVYPDNDTAANTVGGQTVYIIGSGFDTNNAVYINGNAVPSKSFISASNVSFTTPALSAGLYPVYFINTDTGATAIFVPGLSVSAEPTWVTNAALSEVNAQDAWSISLSATGDSVAYALANGSSLPSGITLAANGLISGTLTTQPETDTQYTFTVVATDAQNQDSNRQFTITASVGEGVLFANNVLLIHANGTNNQNNHAFLDSSNNNHTVTRFGNATQGSYSPFSQTGWSVFLDNASFLNASNTSGKYLTVTNTSALNIGTGDFTMEGWIYPLALPSSDAFPTNWWQHSVLFGRGTPDQGDGYNLILGATKLIFQNNDGQVTNGTHNIAINKWYHVAACRSGGTLRLFVNGTVVATTSSAFTGGAGSNFYIGSETGQGAYFNGYMTDVRLVVGSALYTGAFTPTTTKLTAVANTVLLTCASNRFIDTSNNAYTVNPVNSPVVTPFTPYAPTQIYSSANVGGSIYFDGSGDYLTCPAAPATFGANNFTIETWVWFNSNSVGYNPIMSGYGSTDARGWIISTETDNTLRCYMSNGSAWAYNINTSVTPSINRWTHLAVVRNGSTITMYVDGVASGSNNTVSTSAIDTPTTLGIGYYPYYPGGARAFNSGYFSGTRIVNGTAVYTSNFTRPTAPPTNIANTSILLNYTNAAVIDHTSKHIIETVGDAKLSTSVYKYGNASVYLDGTGDYLILRKNPLIQFGTGDFTIEGWTYLLSKVSNYPCIFSNYNAFTNGNGSLGLFAGHNSANTSKYQLALNGTGFPSIQSSTSIAYNSWVHLAVVRYNGVITLYVNGVADGTVSFSGTLNGAGDNCTIGYSTDEASTTINGYIDEFRITRGYARYTSNFTPPTSAFKDK
jgi:hypothetical protein